MLSCVTSVVSVDEIKLLKYLEEYNNSFLYQKTGFIVEEYQSEMGISEGFVKICGERSGNSKRYLSRGISEPAYSAKWRLVYPRNIKRLKNGGVGNATV